MDCLTKAETEERFRFAKEDAKFCPDCLGQLREILDTDNNRTVFYCQNEMCQNEAQYDEYGNDNF